MVRQTTLVFLLAALLSAASAARAQDAAPPPAEAPAPPTNAPLSPTSASGASASAPAPAVSPTVSALPKGELHHAPVSFADVNKPVLIRASIEHPELVRRAILIYRPADGEPVEVAFERAPNGPYAAVIPAEQVRTPAVRYAIELEDLDGTRRAAFANRNDMHTIQVADERMNVRERAALLRIEDRRSVISASADYVSFGQSDFDDPTTGEPSDVADRYYRLESAYSYRLLRVVSEFGIRLGIVRGSSPVSGDATSTDVGLNYGAPFARFRLADVFHLDVQALTSLTEVGFSGGVGGALHVGDIYGSKLEVGFEAIEVFGNRFYSRVDVATASPVTIAVAVEATNMPHASRYGVRLIGELGADLGRGFRAAARGGYQARDSASGGPAAGVTVAYAF